MRKYQTISTVCLLMLGLAVGESDAVPVQLQLVKQGAPEHLISAGDTPAGGYTDRCEVFIDGKNPFAARAQEAQRWQSVELTVELAPGKHTLTPGNHEFTVSADGTVATSSPGLAADGKHLKVLMVPLTFETRDAESGARRVPGVLQPVLDANGRVFERPWYFNPRYPTCATIYVPNGSSFVLQPQGAELAVSAAAVAIKSDPTHTLQADGLTVTITMTPLRFTFQRNGHQDGRGILLALQGNGLSVEQSSIYQWGASSCDYRLLLPSVPASFTLRLQQNAHELGRLAPGTPLSPDLMLQNREYPCSSLLVSRLDERSDGTYTFFAGIPKLKYRSGEAVNIHHEFHQDGIAPAMKGPRLAALLRPEQFAPGDALPWQPLPATRLPDDLPTNRYRLRLVMVEENGDPARSALYRDFIIGVVNPAQTAVAALFLPAERWNYRAGEEIEAQGTLQLKEAATGSLRLRVRGERLDRMLEATPAKKFAPGRHGLGWVLGSKLTSALKPGGYALTVVFAGKDGKTLAESLPQRVTLSSTVRRSLFPGVIDCYGDGWLGTWLGGSKEGARHIFGIGADVLRFDGWYQTLPTEPLAPMETKREVLPDDPDLPPVEITRAPPAARLAFDEALPYGAAILPSLFPSDGPSIETKLPHLLAEQRRFVRLHAQFWRRCPSYAGISYSHWSNPSYTGATGSGWNVPPADDVKATRAAIWAQFCQRSGVTGEPPTNWLPLTMPFGGAVTPANQKLWEQWVRYTNQLLPAVHRDWGRAAAEICPTLLNTDSRGAPGFWNGPREAYDGYLFGNHYQNTDGLNLIEGVTNDDWGIEPYSLELMADLFSFGWRQGKPVWVGGWAQNGLAQSEYQREALQTLAHGALPALYGASLAPVFASRANDDWMHQDWGRRQATERVFQTTAAYGDWAWRFTADKPLAILVSFSQSAVGEGRAGFAPLSPHGAAIYEAYVACLLAGYSPTFVYEEEIAADPNVLNGFKGILLVNITRPLPDPITRALQSFAGKGGAVIADATSAAELPATARLPLTFDAYQKYGSTEFGKENNSSEYTSGYWWHMRQIALAHRPALQAALDNVVRPIAQSDRPGVLLTSARAGEGLLVYATNDTPLPYKNSTDMTRPFIYLHQCWTSPEATANVTLHADNGVLYDALRMREVPLEKTADGLRFTAAFPDLSGTLYVLLPRRIHGVQVEGARRAGALTLRTSAVDDAGKVITAPVPLEIIVTDTAKTERYHLYRVAGVEELPVAVNDLSGDWTITVRELLSGKSVAATIAVQPAAWPAIRTARPSLIVTDKGAVAAFLKSKRPVTIALDRRQAALQPIAKRLGASLGAKVRWLDELPRGPLYSKLLWSATPLPPEEPVKGALILLGTPQDNALLAKLADAGVLLRTASADYPGDDGAVITHVWSAFTGDDPVLAVMAASEAGLRSAIAHLRSLSSSYDPVPALEQARAEMMPPLFRAASVKKPVAKSLKLLKGTPGQSSQLAINPPGDAIRALAVSADGAICAMGTDSPVHGVVRSDKPAAKLDRQFVQQIALTPDARYLVAATTQPPAVFVQDVDGKELWSKTDIPFDWGSDPRWTRDEPDYFALSPGGDRVIVRQNPQRLVCYETATGKQLWERSYASPDSRIWRDAHRLRFSGDGTRLIVSVTAYLTNAELATKLGNTATEALDADLKTLDGEARHQLLALDPATGNVQWTRTERTIPVAARSHRGHFFPLFTPRPDLDARGLYFQPRRLGYYLSVSHDGGRICASDELGNHSIYAGDGSLIASYALPGRPVLSPDGTTLAIYRDGVTMVNLATGKQQALTLDGQEEVSDVAWSGDSRRLAVARWDGLIQVVEATGKTLGTVPQPHGVGAVLLPLPAGGWLAGTSHGQLLRIDAEGK